MITNSTYTKCPKCGAIHSYTEIVSEKTTGVELWSDGFMMTPLRLDIIKFGKCPACNTFFWLQENSIQAPANLTEITNLENSWSIDTISSKEFDFIKEAFRSGLADTPEKEIVIRINLWHTINHIIRKYDSQGVFQKIKQKFFETAEYKEALKHYNANSSIKINNLIRIVNLLKTDKTDFANYLLFAEIYRELGDFSKCMVFCYKAETSSRADSHRIELLKQHITSKNKMAYKI